MPTRIETYRNHTFHSIWEEIVELTGELKTHLEATSDEIQNLARLRKAVTHIDALKNTIDKELVPPSLWDNFGNISSNLLGHLKANAESPTAASIDNANVQADALIQLLSPYTIMTGDAASAVGAALLAQSDAITKHAHSLETALGATFKKAEETDDKLEALLAKANEMKSKIEKYQIELFDDSGSELGIKSKIEEMRLDTSAARESILEYTKELIGEGEDTSRSIAHAIEESKKSVAKNNVESGKLLTDMSAKLQELSRTHDLVMGYETDEGEQGSGLRGEYDAMMAKLKEYDEAQTKTHQALQDEIKGLLPGALSTGLASSFAEQRATYQKPINDFGGLFNLALGGLLILGLTTMFQWTVGSAPTFALPTDLESVLYGTVARAPLILPLVWFAYYAAKRRNEYRRLEEEYAHKETIARSYHSFKQQVEQLEGEDANKLSAKLLEAAIGAVATNASIALDKDHDDGMPIMDKIKEIEQIKDALNVGK